MNVGATSETDYGGYFMWGSTKANTPDECTWAKAPFNGGTWDAWTKYCTNSKYGTVDNKTTLDPEDDAARVNMGGDWRMPTQDELLELYNNTTNEWATINGVSGRKFTSKINGNSIFIPAAGYCGDGSVGEVDNGSVWSSSLSTFDNSHAWRLYFGSEDFDVDTNGRDMGMSVRGVL